MAKETEGPSDETRFGGLTRSELMSRIRGHGNKTTEVRLAELLTAAGIEGWTTQADAPGKPDFVWARLKIALFVDGCFWHGHDCQRNLTPRNNAEFWQAKVARNRKRDARTSRLLKESGWAVMRIWECQLKKQPKSCVTRIKRLLTLRGKKASVTMD